MEQTETFPTLSLEWWEQLEQIREALPDKPIKKVVHDSSTINGLWRRKSDNKQVSVTYLEERDIFDKVIRSHATINFNTQAYGHYPLQHLLRFYYKM